MKAWFLISPPDTTCPYNSGYFTIINSFHQNKHQFLEETPCSSQYEQKVFFYHPKDSRRAIEPDISTPWLKDKKTQFSTLLSSFQEMGGGNFDMLSNERIFWFKMFFSPIQMESIVFPSLTVGGTIFLSKYIFFRSLKRSFCRLYCLFSPIFFREMEGNSQQKKR